MWGDRGFSWQSAYFIKVLNLSSVQLQQDLEDYRVYLGGRPWCSAAWAFPLLPVLDKHYRGEENLCQNKQPDVFQSFSSSDVGGAPLSVLKVRVCI